MKQTWLPGRDSKAVRHPANAGALRPSPDAHRPTALVLGGGIAGIAAAVGLAERGVSVTLVEREQQLGGRVRAWPVEQADGSTTTMSRGFHAFFRQYYNLRGLLRRVDPALEGLTAVDDYPLVLAGGHRDSFANVPKTPPLNMAAFVAQSPSFTAADLANIDKEAVWELLDVDFPATFSAHDGESAAAFLDRLGFPDAARHLALEVFARSFFASPDEFSAGELVGMFHSYFLGSSEGLLFDVPVDDYDTVFWAPLGRYLHRLGVEVRTGESVHALDLGADDGQVRITTGAGTLTADTVVLATDLRTTRHLVDGTASIQDDADWRGRLLETTNAPRFAVWRLWLDRRVDAERPAFLGTSGYGPMDNITVLERFEAGARRWSDEHEASVVEVHAYALQPEDGDDDQVRATLRAELARVYPETADAQVVADAWLVEDDCPLVGTSPWLRRPEVATPDPRLVLAGDGIRCDYPVALMERAATTGFLAANQLLAGWGLAGHDLWTVPMSTRQPALLKAKSLLDRVSA
ncbi:FAD-dependent oxidoreductase [Microlunatus capsulatus]|uniref:Isorenieratene synthase n=1 Tax=Microlunatus capsulatus TaxID=99117 RepID=A0ABS4ZA43_9ACTN|nr:FAD-dependent oxidoreductase [Microlunatus capsulatus]MBP2417918.1 isorenieratene synthase [Microlunatus capsulatus]